MLKTGLGQDSQEEVWTRDLYGKYYAMPVQVLAGV